MLRERGTVWWGVGWACDGCGGGGREVEDEDGGREVIWHERRVAREWSLGVLDVGWILSLLCLVFGWRFWWPEITCDLDF